MTDKDYKTSVLSVDPTSAEAHALFTALLREHLVHREWLLNRIEVAKGNGSPSHSHMLMDKCFVAHNEANALISSMERPIVVGVA